VVTAVVPRVLVVAVGVVATDIGNAEAAARRAPTLRVLEERLPPRRTCRHRGWAEEYGPTAP
jgi:hypothetical protein